MKTVAHETAVNTVARNIRHALDEDNVEVARTLVGVLIGLALSVDPESLRGLVQHAEVAAEATDRELLAEVFTRVLGYFN